LSGKNRTKAAEKSQSAAFAFLAGRLIKLRGITTLLAEHRSCSATSSDLGFAIAGAILVTNKALATKFHDFRITA
jgi:hypothetical protein